MGWPPPASVSGTPRPRAGPLCGMLGPCGPHGGPLVGPRTRARRGPGRAGPGGRRARPGPLGRPRGAPCFVLSTGRATRQAGLSRSPWAPLGCAPMTRPPACPAHEGRTARRVLRRQSAVHPAPPVLRARTVEIVVPDGRSPARSSTARTAPRSTPGAVGLRRGRLACPAQFALGVAHQTGELVQGAPPVAVTHGCTPYRARGGAGGFRRCGFRGVFAWIAGPWAGQPGGADREALSSVWVFSWPGG